MVTLRAVIDENGDVTRVEILNTAHPLLVRAVKEAVEKSKFRPATRNGKAVEGTYNLTVRKK